MELPEIIKDRMDMELSDQLSVTIFPEDGQPACDVIKINFTEIEGKVTSIYLTPCEAMGVCNALNSAVQMYLYNQEQYRKEILEIRLQLSEKRATNIDKNENKE